MRLKMVRENYFRMMLHEHNVIFSKLEEIKEDIDKAIELIKESLTIGKKILVCGNGGSAADSQHLAAELIGRFERDRRSLPSIALITDTSVLTALGNDYGYDKIFVRQLEGLGNEGDTLVGISTSGKSQNVVLTIDAAKRKGIKTIGLLGHGGGEIANLADVSVIVPHVNTARIQEAHVFIIHYWCACLERKLFAESNV